MKQAVILAAGEGQRLRPFTVTRPKAMVSIADKPILQYVVESLVRNDIRRIVIVAGYRRDQIFDYFGGGEQFDAEIVYITQEKQLGTAHALVQVKDVVDDNFLVLPGDNLISAETIAEFVTAKPNALLIKKVADMSRYGVVAVENGVVKDIIEKPKNPESDIVNTGIYAFERGIFEYLENELDIPDVINSMLGSDIVFNAWETTGTWLDVVYPWDILSLNNGVLRNVQAGLSGTIEEGVAIKGTVSVGKGTVVRSNSYIIGPVVIGENCVIGPGVCIMPSTSIGDNVVISAFSAIENSVIRDDVNIGPGAVIQDSVIDDSCVIKGNFTACGGEAEVRVGDEYQTVNIGAMLGVGCYLGNNVVADPGVMLGNYSRVKPLKLIRGQIPDRSLIV